MFRATRRVLVGVCLMMFVVPAAALADVTVTGSITSSSPTETGSIGINGAIASCDSPKAFPGVLGNDQVGYDAHTFSNTTASPQCVTVTENPETCGSDIFSVAYTSFDPSDISKNYLSDLGSAFATTATYSFTVPALSSFEIVEMVVDGPGELCSGYTLDVNGTGIIAGVAAPPTATITTPASGGSYTVGQSVPYAFTCAESTDGSGLTACADNQGDSGTLSGSGATSTGSYSGTLNTSTAGPYTYTVTATSEDGQTATATISYTVTAPVVTAASIAAEIKADVDASTAYKKLNAKSQTTLNNTIQQLVTADLNALKPPTTLLNKLTDSLLLGAFKLGTTSLEAGGYLTKAQVTTANNQAASL